MKKSLRNKRLFCKQISIEDRIAGNQILLYLITSHNKLICLCSADITPQRYWGDSTITYNVDLSSHTYNVGGVYNVTLKYVSPTGCEKSITKPVYAEISCNGNRIWLDSRLSRPPGGIDKYQWQMNTGAGWVNVLDTGVYHYPSPYTAGPNYQRLTISGAGPSYNGYQYRCYSGTEYAYFTIRYTNKWTGAVSNEWENAANWS